MLETSANADYHVLIAVGKQRHLAPLLALGCALAKGGLRSFL